MAVVNFLAEDINYKVFKNIFFSFCCVPFLFVLVSAFLARGCGPSQFPQLSTLHSPMTVSTLGVQQQQE